tara:strand:- start:15611 stop:17236 length:1626 start_codon:yes stop_codon:yes gene_type:complete
MEAYAQQRYQLHSAEREDYLTVGREASSLTLPYLLTESGHSDGATLTQPWQSIGAKGVNVLSAKLMLGLFPINTSFFKLQINDAELEQIPEVTPEIRSEVDLSLSKIERMIKQAIAETSDRVILHTAMKHLIVTGNALVFAGKKNLKVFPLDRYVISRDGDGTVTEIITKEIVDRSLLPKEFQAVLAGKDVNAPGEDGPKFGVISSGKKGKSNDAEVYTCVKLVSGQHHWHQECDGKIIPGSKSTSPIKFSPWLPLRFNVVDGESYGRGRVEEYIGDLKSLESLMKSMVQGSAAASKVVFLVSPSATTKPKSLATATSGSIISGRPDDVGVVQVGKTADFRTVQEMINGLTQRLSDAFLVLNVRNSERTTATEVQAVQQELNEQLSGVFGSLTTELLFPYLNRKLHLLKKSKKVPPLPKGLVSPVVVAGIYNVGRGQDRAALMEFVQTIAQGMGPEALQQYINPTEFLKRLAAASGIDTLNLIKDPATMEQEQQQAQQQGMMQSLVGQAGQLAKSPIGEQLIQNGTGQEEASPEAQESEES